MTEKVTLEAVDEGNPAKKGGRSRQKGRVPAVIHGAEEGPTSIHLEERALVKALKTGHFMNSVVVIEAGGKPVKTLPKDVAFHPITDRPIHVDFLRISEDASVTVAIPIRFVGEKESPGLARGGLLKVLRYEIELDVRANNIPEEVDISLKGIDIDEPIRLSSIELPKDTKSAHPDDPIVAMIEMLEPVDVLVRGPLIPATLEKEADSPSAKPAIAHHRDDEANEDFIIEAAAEILREHFETSLGKPIDHLNQIRALVARATEVARV